VTRVLIVEDEESYSDALAYVLGREGFQVSVVATGPDALAHSPATGPTWSCSISSCRDCRVSRSAVGYA